MRIEAVAMLLMACTLGCLHQAKRPIVVEEVSKLRVGQTTQADIVNIYGEPQSKGLNGDTVHYCYRYDARTEGWQLLFLTFDQQNVLTGKHLNDREAREHCTVGPANSGTGTGSTGSGFGFGSGNSGGSNGCKYGAPLLDGTDKYGRPKYRCPGE